MSALPVVLADIEAAAQRIEGHAHRTPVLTSSTIDRQTGGSVFFKCENFQRAGAFKFRGAFNALSKLSADERRRGVLTFSSGNHAQAIALSGRLLSVPTVVVMPNDAPAVKVRATREYGAEVVLYDKHEITREALGKKISDERGLVTIPPYDHADVIAGQGTAALELFAKTGPLDYLFVCVGGGGLISGCAAAAAAVSPGCKVIGVEPEAGDDATRSFKTKTLQTVTNPETIADGARTPSLGKLTFTMVMALVHDMMTVSDKELATTMFYLWERMKIVVEPTGALAATAALSGRVDLRGKRVGVLISGGNVDMAAIPGLLAVARG
ncbi:MAG TPA: threo-3-hydroxy-L-aspartate ammonia-lyase [Vicinamibacteria bacterium]|nr:threo-3-hydroxy-L-aspartate ammonia-lyase [Vicinamibacteria bacterium]